MSEIVIVMVIVIVLIAILSFFLYYIMKRTSLLMKNNFLAKIEKLDGLIGDKEQKIDDLNQSIDEKKKLIEQLIENDNGKSISNNADFENAILPQYADFEDGNLLSSYKIIKKKFDFNTEEIIKGFLSKIKKSDDNYDVYLKIRSYFTYDVLYRLSTYPSNEQLLIIRKLLDNDEEKLLNIFLKEKKFNLKKFVHELDDLIVKSNPTIYIYVGDKSLNYNHLNNNIKTIYDEKITEGFKIVYKGIIYDFSI